MPAKLDADMRSLAAASPPRGASTNKIHYYMHNPLPGGGYKSSSMQATPIESPSHPSFDRHSRSSFGSRHFGNRKAVNTKGWPECNIIQEEGSDEGLYGRKSSLSLLWKIMMWFISFCLVLAIIGLVIWGAERPNMPDVVVKTIAINDFYASEGTHHSGVPTKMVTLNCSLSMVVHNPASMFGIHVTSGPILLMYSDIVVGVGKVHKYYQPKDSHRHVSVVIHGHKVLLYGAGDGLDLSRNDGSVPLTLDFVLISRGYIISELVRVTHNVHVTCKITVDAKATRPIRFPKDACAIYKA